ncbi:MAG: PASTA domain-containing protein [Clostridia bacterium]|nr:PASTA domain-containing protein [Clostridia bacterium]
MIITRRARPFFVALWLALAVTVFCALYLFTVYLPRTDGDSVRLEIPDLIGTPLTENDERLPDTLYEVVYDYRADADTPAGTVLSQEPAPHATRRAIPDRARCVLRLTVSTGARSYTVPALIGVSAREATVALREAGLIVKTRTVTRNDLSAGQIIAVSPAEGTQMREGEVITLTVSDVATSRVVRVPDVVGMPLPEANAALVLHGLRPQATTASDPTSALGAGLVCSQQPLSGTLVPSGTRARLTLSEGRALPNAADEELAMEGE